MWLDEMYICAVRYISYSGYKSYLYKNKYNTKWVNKEQSKQWNSEYWDTTFA